MKSTLSVLVAGLALSFSASAAVVQYTITGTGSGGTTGSGTLSFDDTVVGPDYASPFAQNDVISFSVTLQVVGGTPSTTTFDLSTVGSDLFVLMRFSGEITDFNPGGSNGDGYTLTPSDINEGMLSGNSVNETMQWSYALAAVPEPGTYAAFAGVALGGFAVVRQWKRSSRLV